MRGQIINWSKKMVKRTYTYTIEADVPPTYSSKLMDFIYRGFRGARERFANVSKCRIDGHPSITYISLDLRGRGRLKVEVIGSKPIRVRITPIDRVQEDRIRETRQDVVITVQMFEERVRRCTLFFAWREGEEIVPEKVSGKEKRPINRLFLETQILMFFLFISLGMFLFLFLGWLAPLALLAMQSVFVIYSRNFISKISDWRITENNPFIHILEYHLPLGEHDNFRRMHSGEKLLKIKREIYEQTISKRGKVDCGTVYKVLKKYGIECRTENLVAKKVNVYNLVKRVADGFGFPMPEVVVSNTLVPNAAASGPSPSRGIVLITTGLLVELDEDEILSVLGHEFGHLKGRDPILLFGLSAGEFLFRFYVLFPLFPFIFYSFFFFFYYFMVMSVIFFIAKFFEARADLMSTMVVGQPKSLARALEKIGFKRLLYERIPQYRSQEWTSLEPHPPVYFRVARLEKLKVPVRIKHPLIQSARDVIRGFRESL